MNKKSKLLAVFLALIFTFNTISIGAAAQNNLPLSQAKSYIAEEDREFFNGSAIIDFNAEEEIGNAILNFFSEYFTILETGDISDYTDVSDVNFYLFTKWLEYTHSVYDVMYHGITDTSVSQFLIKDVNVLGDNIDAAVYVTVSYVYNGDSENSIGSLYHIRLNHGEVVALDTVSIDTQMIKDTLNTELSALNSSIVKADFKTTANTIDELFKEKEDRLFA